MIEIKKLKKEGLIFLDMHSHTNLSDGSQTYQESIDFSRKNNFNICITDHNEIKGSFAIKDFTLYSMEITGSDAFDILVYFAKPKDLLDFYNKSILKNKIKEHFFTLHKLRLNIGELVDAASDSNALISLPHPFTINPKKSYDFFNNNLNKNILKKVDAIEGYNSVLPPEANKKAISWAGELNKPLTAGSDAHCLNRLGSSLTACYASSQEDFIEQIRKEKSMIYCKEISSFSRNWTSLKALWNNVKFS